MNDPLPVVWICPWACSWIQTAWLGASCSPWSESRRSDWRSNNWRTATSDFESEKKHHILMISPRFESPLGITIDIDHSESEMAFDMCRLQYQTERWHYQACPMCLIIAITPILQWHNIDGVVWLKILQHKVQTAAATSPSYELEAVALIKVRPKWWIEKTRIPTRKGRWH